MCLCYNQLTPFFGTFCFIFFLFFLYNFLFYLFSFSFPFQSFFVLAVLYPWLE